MNKPLLIQFNQWNIGTKLGMGFSMFLFLFILVSIFDWNSRNDNQRAFDLYSQVSASSTAILVVNHQIIDLQSTILSYSQTGHKAGMVKINDLYAQVQEGLAIIRPSFADTERQSILVKMNAVLSTYNENIDTLFADRGQYDQYIAVILPQAANEVRTILKSLSKFINHENYPAMQSYIEQIAENFLSAMVDANSFFATHNYKSQRRAKASLGEAVKIWAKLQTHKNAVELGLVKDLGVAINNYSNGFNHALRVSRGYLFLVNVVIPGTAAEFENLSDNLTDLTLKNLKEVSERTERNVQDSQQKISIITAIGIVIGAILAFLISKSIVTPLQTISVTFRQLVKREHVDSIPGLDRNDEIGQLAKAAEVFRVISENRFQSIFDESPIGIAVIDSLTGHIHEANAKFTKIAGRTLEEMTTINWMKITHPDDVQEDLDNMARLNTGEFNGFQMDKRYLHPDGTAVWINMTIAPIQGSDKTSPHHLCMIEDISKRKQAEDKIKTSLKEKETLLKELYHRTKNNMQVIMAMINLQTRNIEDENILQMFNETTNRISTMALVHEKLYQAKDLSRINLKDYFTDLINLLSSNYQILSERIRIKTDMNNAMVTIDSAIPCGLIMNELISNSFKYAFPENQGGEIQISLKMTDDKEIEFTIGDNGIGLPEGFEYRDTNTMGLQVVVALAEGQILGSLRVAKGKGTQFHITFKEKPCQERV